MKCHTIPMLRRHGWEGACAPKGPLNTLGMQSFSVGVFQWLPKTSGMGLKRSPAKVRVVGPMNEPEKVYEKAYWVAQQLDDGSYKGPKRVVVK